jgi:GTP-binding protein EngB required for normal cell division
LKKLYKGKIQPIEQLYRFTTPANCISDAEFDAKPQVMLLGQYSVGKSTFIKYLLEGEYPGSHIGPEPTTDRFMCVMHGVQERRTPGNALAVSADKPFRGLSQFGTGFLTKLECAQTPSPILESLTFIDTPGVLSGSKQTMGRTYDFAGVMDWFAEKSDLILLLFDAHKLDISDEFKEVINQLKRHDEKIRVVLNKADSIETQALMRVYGALMWSLGKVKQTPEVTRVFISSFWDKPFQNQDNAALFESERNDLFKELRELPRYSAMRKINDLVKRARSVKVHALIIGTLAGKMPSFMGKAKAQKALVSGMGDIFRHVQREHGLAFADFPDLAKFQLQVSEMDFSAFPKLDLAKIAMMETVLGQDVPALLAQFPPERADESAARARTAGASAPNAPSSGAGDAFGGGSGGAGGSAGNPFAKAVSASAGDETAWVITPSDQATYRSIFQTCNPIDGKVSGEAAKGVLEKSKLDYETLGKVWNMSDMDKDGYLDEDEFAVTMHLCHQVMEGIDIGDTVAPNLIPPSKRALFKK